jgi:hypothetical protein
MASFEITVKGHRLVQDTEGRDALRVDYEFINQVDTGVPTEKAADKAVQNGVELEKTFDSDGDDGAFPYPLRNGGGVMAWTIYLIQDKSPVTVTFYDIENGAEDVYLTETFEV